MTSLLLWIGLMLIAIKITLVSWEGVASLVQKPITRPVWAPQQESPSTENLKDAFANYLENGFPPADGFDFPVGDSDGDGSYTDLKTKKTHHGYFVSTSFGKWYSYGIHPGEDWNGNGGSNTDLGQPVHSVAGGRVIFAENCKKAAGVVVIQHRFYENHQKKKLHSVYRLLGSIRVKAGEVVRRRQVIGSIGQDPDRKFNAHLHFELRWDEGLSPTYWPSSDHKSLDWIREHYVEPSVFIRGHRQLFVPPREPVLALVDTRSHRLRLYQNSRLVGDYPVAFGLNRERRNRQNGQITPAGMYFVIGQGPGNLFQSWTPLGGWIKLNYPNRYDLAQVQDPGALSPEQETELVRAWQDRRPTLIKTVGGDELGFRAWNVKTQNLFPSELPWGTLMLHEPDLKALSSKLPTGAMVVIF